MALKENEVYSLAKFWSDVFAPKVGADPNEMAKYLTGIAKKESNYNPNAKNKGSTARGLMQMLIATQREVESKYAKVPFANAHDYTKHFPKAPVNKLLPDKIYDQDYSMQLAAAYLAYLYKRYKGDWTKTVHAYNQGSYPGVNKSTGANYAASVIKNIQKLPETLAYNPRNMRIDTKHTTYIYSAFI